MSNDVCEQRSGRKAIKCCWENNGRRIYLVMQQVSVILLITMCTAIIK